MHRYVPVCLVVALSVGCADLTNVPPPPVPLSVLEGPREAAAADELIGTTQARVRLMRAVGPNALFALQLPDIGGSVERFEKTGLYRWFTSPEVEKQLGGAFKVWATMPSATFTGPGGQGGLDFDRLGRALQGELVFAVEQIGDSKGPVPDLRLVAGLTVTGAEREAEQLLQLVDMMAAGQEGVHVEKGTVGGHGYSRIVGKEPAPWVVELALYEDALLAGFGRDTVTRAMERLDDEERSSLADEPGFRAAMERCGDPRDAIRLHVDLEEIYNRYGHLLPREAGRVIKALGLHHLRSLAVAVRFEGSDIVVSSLIDSPGGRDCITELLAAHTVDRRFLNRFPADTSSFSIFAFDGNRVIQTLRTALPEEMRGGFESFLSDLRRDGVDLEAEVFEVFGPRCAIVNLPLDRLDDGVGIEALWSHLLGTAFICEVQDPARAARILARLPERTPRATRREVNVEGLTAHVYAIQGDELPPDFALGYVLDGSYLVVAPSEEALRRLLRPRSPETAERFRKAIEEAPDSAVVLSYDDMRKGPGIYLDAFLKGLSSSTGGALPPRRDAREPLGLLTKLGPSVSYTVADEQGIYSFQRSPTGGFGSLGGLSGLGMIAAVAVPNLHQARVNANETATIATLESIYTAQTTFRANRYRDKDRDGEGEFGFLSELLGQPRPGEKEIATATPLLSGTFARDGDDFTRHGYYFRVYLPAEDGSPVGEHLDPERIATVDGDLAEAIMVVVAWPVNRGISGHRAFYLDGEGRLFACTEGPYSKDDAPRPDVLNTQEGNLASRPLPQGQPTRDGHRWLRIR